MTIEKGEPWGAPGALPDGGVVVRTDAEARHALTEARRRKEPFPALQLLGGDLCRTMGGPGNGDMTFPVDLGEVLLDGRLHLFVAHLVARRRFWRGHVVVAMNANWLGPYDLGPKGHPNDGLLDTSEGALPFRELLMARTRARTGTHVPHPRIETRRVNAAQFHFDKPVPVRLDGELVGSFRDISVRVAPDALTVVS